MVFDKPATDLSFVNKLLRTMALREASGLIRPLDNPSMGVKFRFDLNQSENMRRKIRLVGISKIGIQKLSKIKQVTVEVFGQDHRVSFQVNILKVSEDGVWVSVPSSIEKTERRTRQRHACRHKKVPLFKPGDWEIDISDVSAPPVFGLYQPLANWTLVDDLSFGGLCVETRFPSVVSWLERSPSFEHSMVQLPMTKPFMVHTELRWSKRIRERIETEDGLELSIQKYKFGLEFMDPSMEFLQAVAEFLKIMDITKDAVQGDKG